MKKYLLLLLLPFSLLSQQKKFTLTANIKGIPDGKQLFLVHKYNDQTIADSMMFNKETAKLKSSTPEPNMYWLAQQKNAAPLIIFFIDGGQVEITGSIDSLGKAKVKAGKTQEDYKLSQDFANNYMAQRTNWYKEFQSCQYKGDQACAQRIIDSAQKSEKQYINNIVNFIKKNPQSNIGGYIIFSATFEWITIEDYDKMYNALGDKVKKGKFGKLALEKINSIKGTTIGYPALDFAQDDPDGKSVSLSSLKGKYVLVDFWASWCGPCRKENPTVVAAFNRYKDKGFTVFGVSLDDNKAKWLQAIEKDGLAWTHVSDLKGWQNEAAKVYGVRSIPFNLLLDKEGKILAKNLRGEQLEAELLKIFGE